jgi:hypothetical protein
MRVVEKFISPLVEAQFPEFYKDQGPLFILFVEEYYRWLESNDPAYANYLNTVADGNPNYHIRRLLEYRDVDQTLDNFIVYLKEKYLKGIQFETEANQRKLIKAAQDLFKSKGSQRSLDLLFKLAYGASVEIFTPGDFILKASDGTWTVPRYLELSRTTRTLQYPGKTVTGSISGASAFVEYVITRNINGKLIDLAFVSNLKGDFLTGESVLDSAIVEDAPKITGSLTSLLITLAGELFQIGEIVNITSPRGVEGLARVVELDEVTGIVRFSIIDSGWGYSLDAVTEVSEKTYAVTNITNSNSAITNFQRFETVKQDLIKLSLTNVTGEFNTRSLIINGNTSVEPNTILVSVEQDAAASNTANLILNTLSGDIVSNSFILDKNKAIIATYDDSLFTVGDLLVQSDAGTNNVTGVVSSVEEVTILEVDTSSIGSNGIHVGTFIEQTSTSAQGTISASTRENLYTFTNVSHISVTGVTGTFDNSNPIIVYTNSTKATQLGTFNAQQVFDGYQYLLVETNLTDNTRWSFGNTAVKASAPTVNSVILVASDVGGLLSTNTDVSATGNVVSSNSTTIGINDDVNTFYAFDTTRIRGLSSNTYADLSVRYTGFGADFSIGALDNIETVRVSSDLINSNNDGPGASSVKFIDMLISGANSTFGNVSSVYVEYSGTGYDNTNIVTFTGGNTGVGSFTVGNASITTDASGNIVFVTLSANTGNGIVTTPTASVVNSTGGSTGVGTGASIIPVSSLGFIKLPAGDINDPLLELLRFSTKTIGSISSLTGINPGEQYNANPFVIAYEPEIAALGKADYIINISNTVGTNFLVGEVVEETSNISSIEITGNNYSGNSSLNFEAGELVYATDGVSNTGTGIVYSTVYNSTSNNYTLIIIDTTGTFGVSDQLVGTASNSSIDITASASVATSVTARAIVKSFDSSLNLLSLRRVSLFADLTPGGTLIGKTSGTSATIDSVAADSTARVAGDNANISANVVTSTGAISNLEIISSGYGYENNESATISSIDGSRVATGTVKLGKQGVGQGYYTSTRGFLDNNIFIHDGEYYQNYSYEIRTSISFDVYSEVLKNVLHIAGKKFFGRIVSQPEAVLEPTISTSITIS